MLGLRALDPASRLLLHAMNHVSEVRFSVGFEADDFAIKQC